MADHRFTCNLCEAMCGLQVKIEGSTIGAIRGDPDDPFSRGHVCPKANALRELHEDPDRLRSPMRKTANGFVPIGWDEALQLVGEKLRALRTAHGKDAIALYVGNPTVHSHRASLGSQVLTAALGTKNRFDPNSQDSNPRLFACWQMYGDPLSIPVPDIDRTQHVLMLGANPAVSNGSMWALGDVRRRFAALRERGGSLVVVDPRVNETATTWATRHHFIRPGGDAALLFALLAVLFEEGLVQEGAVRVVARGLGALRELARELPPERVAPAIGIPAPVIRAMARELAAAKAACVYGRVGTCQNEFGPVASWLIEALNVVTGNLDRPGGSMFPTPAADIGPLGRVVMKEPYARWRSRVRGLPEFLGALPSAVLAEEIETPGEGQIRALVCFAGNPVLSTPNGARLERALGSLDFMVAVDMYLNETTRHADVVLPTKHVFETGNFDLVLSRFTVRNVAKYSAPILETTDDTRDDWDVLADLAVRIAGPDVAWLQRGLRRAARRLPERIVDGLLRTGRYGLSLAELDSRGRELGPLVPSLRERVHTVDRKIQLAPELLVRDVPRLVRWIDARARDGGGLRLVGRRHLRSNNSWMHNARSLVKGPARTQVLLHPSDAERLGLPDGALVRLRSRVGAVTATLTVDAAMMPGVASLPHGWGHASAAATLSVAGAIGGPNANELTDEELVEPVLGTSILNGVPITIERA